MKLYCLVTAFCAASAIGNVLSLGAVQAQDSTGVKLQGLLDQDPALARQLGIQKLTTAERLAWDSLLAVVFEKGMAARSLASTHASMPDSSLATVLRSRPITAVYETRIESDDDDLLRLENGGIVEVVSGYLGYLGYRKHAVLFQEERICRIWIEDKRVFSCTLLKPPAGRAGSSGAVVYITRVRGNGSILELADRTLLEVDPIDTIYTSIWIAGEALLIDGVRLINLDYGGEVVNVTPVR